MASHAAAIFQLGPLPVTVMAGVDEEQRFRRIVRTQMDYVWRCLRRLGVPDADVDDAVQQVLLVAHSRLDDIPETSERAFLFATATRVAANARRAARRRNAAMEHVKHRPEEPQLSQEALSEQLRARTLLDAVMEELPEDLRNVFILFEIEEVPVKDIAEALDIPLGTVGSKLRRARKCFSEAVRRIKAKQEFYQGTNK